MTVDIDRVKIGQGQPCRFVAEISNSHNGEYGLATALIDAAKSAGADFVKFQCYTADELVELRGDGPAPGQWGEMGWTMRTLYTRASTPLKWFPDLFAYARKIGIVPFSSVFGAESLKVLQSVDCPAYKIARLDNEKDDLIALAVHTGKPVIVSSSEQYGDDALAYSTMAERVAATLYCPAGYPTPIEAVRLPFTFRCTDDPHDHDHIGVSSHCLTSELPIAAVARGAKLLEYHLQLVGAPSELEANISLNQFQFNQMVRDVRRTELLLNGE